MRANVVLKDELSAKRVSLMGCTIDALTFEETFGAIERLIETRRPVQHSVVNAYKAVLMHKDSRLREIVSHCALVNADGQSLVWASRILKQPLPERVAGIDLFEALLQLAASRGYGIFFLGATGTVLTKVVRRARREHPALRICGWHDGYWEDGEADTVVAEVRAASADILFVGMPSPRKEYWLAEHLNALNVPFSMGVGGSFDVYAGEVRRAPHWMQKTGLEWAFRFAQEPTRMWRRYLVGNLSFLALVLRYRFPSVGRPEGNPRPGSRAKARHDDASDL